MNAPIPAEHQANPVGRLRAAVGDAPAPGRPRRACLPSEPGDRAGPAGVEEPADIQPSRRPDGAADGDVGQAEADAPGAVVIPRLVRLGRRHAGTIGVLLVVALVLAATRVMAAQGHDVQTPPPTPVLTPAASATTSATPSPASLRVHVFGAVASPGVVTLSAGARVADAIEASGGLVLEADCGELNLAAPVQDGSQIIVGTKGNPRGELRPADGGSANNANNTAASSNGSSAPTLDLNTATMAQLDGLPGVGPVTAQRILDWREANGGFTRIEELQEVDGIGAKTFARLAPLVHV